jgi:hypothetical protein
MYSAYNHHFNNFSTLYISIPNNLCFISVIGVSGEPWQQSRYRDWLQAGQWRGQSSSPGRVKNCHFSILFRTDSEAHPP